MSSTDPDIRREMADLLRYYGKLLSELVQMRIDERIEFILEQQKLGEKVGFVFPSSQNVDPPFLDCIYRSPRPQHHVLQEREQIAKFLQENVRYEEEGAVSREAMYRAYKSWCLRTNSRGMSPRMFESWLLMPVHEASGDRIRIGWAEVKDRFTCRSYLGCRLLSRRPESSAAKEEASALERRVTKLEKHLNLLTHLLDKLAKRMPKEPAAKRRKKCAKKN